VRLAVIAAVLAVALVVALVARQTGPVALETYPGLPPGADVPADTWEPGWVLHEDARRISVYAAGSSSCPLAPREAAACTDDLAWTTSVVAVPNGVDLDRLDVEVVVER
jgi:hypothetical protein